MVQDMTVKFVKEAPPRSDKYGLKTKMQEVLRRNQTMKLTLPKPLQRSAYASAYIIAHRNLAFVGKIQVAMRGGDIYLSPFTK